MTICALDCGFAVLLCFLFSFIFRLVVFNFVYYFYILVFFFCIFDSFSVDRLINLFIVIF